MYRCVSSLIVAISICFVCLQPAMATDIQMLPPVDFNDSVCSGTNAGLLYWDGATKMKCVPGSAGNASGDVNFSGNLQIGPRIYTQPDAAGNTWFGVQGGTEPSSVGIGYHQTSGVLNKIMLATSGIWRMVIDKVGNVGIGTSSPKATLDVAGETRVGNTGAACTAANEGSVRYINHAFEGCDGTAWNSLSQASGSWCGLAVTASWSCLGGGYCDNASRQAIWVNGAYPGPNPRPGALAVYNNVTSCNGRSVTSGCPSGYTVLQFAFTGWNDQHQADSVVTCIKN